MSGHNLYLTTIYNEVFRSHRVYEIGITEFQEGERGVSQERERESSWSKIVKHKSVYVAFSLTLFIVVEMIYSW